MKEYAILRCAVDQHSLPLRNPFMRLATKNMRRNHIIKRLPVYASSIEHLGRPGLDITIPLIENELHEVDYARHVIEEWNQRAMLYDINAIVLAKALHPYRQAFRGLVANRNSVLFLYINVIMEKIIARSHKELKDMNFVLIDGDNSITTYIMHYIYDHINNLTIITDRPEHFEENITEIYEETGLAVCVTGHNILQKIPSDIIINCSKEPDKVFYCFDPDSYLVDFVSGDEKIKNILIKREDIHVITDVDMLVNHHLMDKELFHGILLNENRLLRSMELYGYRKAMFEKIKQILGKYHVEIGEMYQRGEATS